MPSQVPEEDFQLFLVQLNAASHKRVCDLHVDANLAAPPEPREGILIASKADLVAATYVYEAGPFLLAEFFIVNPAFPRRVRHMAGEMVLRQFFGLAAGRGLAPVAAPRSRGVRNGMLRCGFSDTGCTMLVSRVPYMPMTLSMPPAPAADVPPPPEPKKKATAKKAATRKVAKKKGDRRPKRS